MIGRRARARRASAPWAAAVLGLVACTTPPPPVETPPSPIEVVTLESRFYLEPRLIRQVEAARGLRLDAELTVLQVDRPRLSARLSEVARTELPPGFLAREGAMLRALGAIPPTVDWEHLLLDELTRSIEGVYLAASNELLLFVVAGPKHDALVAHELVHALQDRHLHLDDLVAFLPGEADRQSARLHLVEGDAVDTVRRAHIAQPAASDPPAYREEPAAEVPAQRPTAPPPPFLTNTLASPYQAGGAFVRRLHELGGQAMVDGAFARPPVSTEQVLHPEKYLRGEAPLRVLLPSLPREGAAWEQVDTFGELALRNLLAEWVGADLARGAAAGWGGDRVAIGKTAIGTVVTLVVAMDDRAHADVLAAALADAFPSGCRDRARYGALAMGQRENLVGFFAGPFVEGEVMPSCKETLRELGFVLRGVQVEGAAPASTKPPAEVATPTP